LAIFIAPTQEGNEVGWGGYAQVEELNDLQVAQVVAFLDGLANALSYRAHFDVKLDQLQ
jgi:hypothetical protein